MRDQQVLLGDLVDDGLGGFYVRALWLVLRLGVV